MALEISMVRSTTCAYIIERFRQARCSSSTTSAQPMPRTPNTVAISNGLIGYWPLDGAVTNWATGKTLDISGNGKTGTLLNMSTSTSPAAGKIGQGWSSTISSLPLIFQV